MDENKVAVIDNGSYMIKAGYAGDEAPRAVFPTVVGRIKNPNQNNVFVGDDAIAKSGILKMSYPIDHGIITNWDDIEKIWHSIFYDELRVDPAEYTALLTEVPMNPKPNREKMVQIMFETFNISSLYLADQASLSIYSFGRTKGIVFSSGAEVSNVVPVKDGNPISQAINTFKLAGSDILKYLDKLLIKSYLPVKTVVPNAHDSIFRDVKERHTYVALDYDSELKKAETTSECKVSYTLPDGYEITINDERFRAPELLFKPNLNGFNFSGIHESIVDSIMKCDEDIRKDLFNNIVLSGGNTMFEGLSERLEKEIKKLAPPGTNVSVIAPPERKYSTWIGGSIYASLATFPQNTLKRDEYNKAGPGIVHNKFK